MKDRVILNIAAWWPTEGKPGNGLFIKEHIQSTDQSCPVIIFLRTETVRFGKPSIEVERNTSDIDEFLIVVKTPLRRFGILESMMAKGFEKGISEVSKAYGHIDLIHFHVRDHVTKYGIELVDRLGIPHVLTEHFSFYHRGIHLLDEKNKSEEKKEISNWFKSANLKQIITVSEEMKSILSEGFQADPNLIQVIPNIASSSFSYSPKPSEGTTRVALVAGWRPPKNPILFFESIVALSKEEQSNMQIDFVGHGEQVELVNEFVQLNLGQMDITIHGYKKKDEIAEILQHADFLVHPTDQENSPTIISEALSCGTPVLSMNVNGIPEMVDESNGILVEPKNLDGLLSGLRAMISKKGDFNYESIAIEAGKKYSVNAVGAKINSVLNAIKND